MGAVKAPLTWFQFFKNAYRLGLSTEQFLNMTLWQYAAYCEAKALSAQDELCTQIQAAYYGAYWSSNTKHKKTLAQIIDAIRTDQYAVKEVIDYNKAEAMFKQMEDLRARGWTQESS